MLRGLIPVQITAGLACSLLSIGCVGGKKKKDAETAAAIPPPAASYPTSTPAGSDYEQPISAPTYQDTYQVPTEAVSDEPSFSLRPGETMINYKIEFGDNLSKIALKYNTSVSRIKAANGLTSDRIFAGKTLQIPTTAPPVGSSGGYTATTQTAPAPSTSSQAGTTSGGGYYGARDTSYQRSSTPYGSGTTTSPSYSRYPSTTSAPPASTTSRSPYSGYSSTTAAPSPSAPSATPPVPSTPSSTSYSRVSSPPTPPTSSSGGAFPQPSFGNSGSQVQFSQ